MHSGISPCSPGNKFLLSVREALNKKYVFQQHKVSSTVYQGGDFHAVQGQERILYLFCILDRTGIPRGDDTAAARSPE
jgi:hypothetical protein